MTTTVTLMKTKTETALAEEFDRIATRLPGGRAVGALRRQAMYRARIAATASAHSSDGSRHPDVPHSGGSQPAARAGMRSAAQQSTRRCQ